MKSKKYWRKKTKKAMLEMKLDEFYRYDITCEYLKDRIENEKETRRREQLTQVQTLMDELERQIKFIEKL